MTEEQQRLYDLDADEDYVEVLYRILLEREADDSGKQFYLDQLESGKLSRRDVLNQLLTSKEARYRNRFKYDYKEVMRNFVEVYPADSFEPWVADPPYEGAQLCELVNPRKWLIDDWRSHLDELDLSSSLQLMHRKGFEWAQTLWGLRRLGMIREDVRCLGVGSGHETILYWLANHVGEVVATDLYEGYWVDEGSREGDPEVLDNPAKYAPFEYREDHLRFLRMDGRDLEFADDSFDVVFSLSSIEHFGGNEGAAAAMAEMGRVCRPDGIVAIATELILNDSVHPEFFTLGELREHVVAASAMKLIQRPEFLVPSYALAHPCTMPEEAFRAPHIVLDFDGVLDTSVLLFFRHG